MGTTLHRLRSSGARVGRRPAPVIALGIAGAVSLITALAWALPVQSRQQGIAEKAPIAGAAHQPSSVTEAKVPAQPDLNLAAPPPQPQRSGLPARSDDGETKTAASPEATLPAPTVAAVRYGPIPLAPAVLGTPAHTYGGSPLVGTAPFIPMPCTNCYVTGTTIDLQYGNGQSANLDTGVMLHHLVLAQRGRPDATCAASTPIGQLGERFFAAGNERTSGMLPAGFGYHFGEGPLGAFFDLMNHSNTPKEVYLTANVSYLPDSTPGIKPVTPVWLDENNCSTSEYAVPAGPSNRVWQWTSTITGRMVAAGGHVHDGGIKTVLTNESTRRQICASHAGYGTKPEYMGTIESMTTCIWDRIGTVRKGDVLALDTHYNSPEPQSDVMGIMIAYVYETDDLTGGSEAPVGSEPMASGGSPPSGGPGRHHG